MKALTGLTHQPARQSFHKPTKLVYACMLDCSRIDDRTEIYDTYPNPRLNVGTQIKKPIKLNSLEKPVTSSNPQYSPNYPPVSRYLVFIIFHARSPAHAQTRLANMTHTKSPRRPREHVGDANGAAVEAINAAFVTAAVAAAAAATAPCEQITTCGAVMI